MGRFVFEKLDELDQDSPKTRAASELYGRPPAMDTPAKDNESTPDGCSPEIQGTDELDGAPTPLSRHSHPLEHRSLRTYNGQQVAADGSTSKLAEKVDSTESHARKMKVKLKATAAAPLELGPGETPSEADLFETGKTGTEIETVEGTVASPHLRNDLKEDNLFIAGAPDAADVRQGGIGDCYFLAVLLGIVNGDPGKISNMMFYNGGNITTDFHRLNSATGQWVEQSVTNTDHLMRRSRADGTVLKALKGAKFRIADAAQTAKWHVKADGTTLKIYRRDVYEAALWGPLMEKSYADFAQQYGQYGGGLKTSETGKSGYSIIDGGASQKCYNMFYGDNVTEDTTQAINAEPGQDLVGLNIPAIKRLIEFETHKGTPGLGGGTQNFMQVRIGTTTALRRCKALSEHVQDAIYDDGGGFWGRVGRFFGARDRRTGEQARLTKALDTLIDAIDAHTANSSSANLNAVGKAADAIQKPGAFPMLSKAVSPDIYKELNENLGIVINAGSDNSPGRRHVYSGHAYNVHSVVLKDKAGTVLNIPSAKLAARASEIDVKNSYIVVENPHAGNESDLDGKGPVDGVNDGRFNLTLDSFLRSFDLLRVATVEHEPALGDFPVPSGLANFA